MYDEAPGPLEAESSTIVHLVGSNQFCRIPWLLHPFQVCALPPSLLFHLHPLDPVLALASGASPAILTCTSPPHSPGEQDVQAVAVGCDRKKAPLLSTLTSELWDKGHKDEG